MVVEWATCLFKSDNGGVDGKVEAQYVKPFWLIGRCVHVVVEI